MNLQNIDYQCFIKTKNVNFSFIELIFIKTKLYRARIIT
jgi:hypothetical protein